MTECSVNMIELIVQIMKLVTMQFCKAPVTSFNSFPAIFLSHLFFNPTLHAFLSGGETKFCYWQNKQEIIMLHIVIFVFWKTDY
jgi:hypothetical protein